MTDFPLWRLRPEDAARIIILEPLKPVERRKFWRKRAMRLKPSDKHIDPDRLKGPRYKPSEQDLKTLRRATHDSQWKAWAEEWAEAFPRIGVLHGPLLRDGRYYSQPQDRPANPLATDRPREPFAGMYSRAAFEADEQYYEAARDLLRENFYLSQTGDGPKMDGLVFMKIDNLLLAEIEFCKARLRLTWAILEQSRKAKADKRPKKQSGNWQSVGNDEAVALDFKHKGYKVRKIDTLTHRHYEVLI